MTVSNVNEEGYCYWLVMVMDRVYHFSDVNEKGQSLSIGDVNW